MNFNFMKNISFYLFFLIVFFYGCSSYNDVSHEPTFTGDIVDKSSWYSDMNTGVVDVFINIPSPNTSLCSPYTDTLAPERSCTFDDVNNDLGAYDSYKPLLNVMISADGFSAKSENAEFKLRGDFSRLSLQKSYSLKLFSDTNLFMKQRKFNFIKHQSDKSRMKNRLAFDLIREIPNLTSLKMQFFHLYINDEDYGLFSHAEAIREEYLVNRGWNKNDRLYNAVGFMFENRDELALDDQGEPLDEEIFESVLEIKNGKEHNTLLEMVDAVNSDIPIDTVIETYFNRKNYVAWLALNLVLSNKDTTWHNFYLYNPENSKKFYFLPWDYDGAWATTEYLGRFEYGVSVWWESPLHKKFLSVQANLDEVYATAQEFRNKYITDANVIEKLDSYEPTVRPFMSVLPDSVKNNDDGWKIARDALVTGIEDNMNLYKSVIGSPMPFREYASYQNGELKLSWQESFDVEGDNIVYDINVSSEKDFSQIVFSAQNIEALSYSKTIDLSPGVYYFQVVAKEQDDSSHYQISFDTIYDENGTYYGVKELEVN